MLSSTKTSHLSATSVVITTQPSKHALRLSASMKRLKRLFSNVPSPTSKYKITRTPLRTVKLLLSLILMIRPSEISMTSLKLRKPQLQRKNKLLWPSSLPKVSTMKRKSKSVRKLPSKSCPNLVPKILKSTLT